MKTYFTIKHLASNMLAGMRVFITYEQFLTVARLVSTDIQFDPFELESDPSLAFHVKPPQN
jgi:hypothetical protein